MPETRAVPQGDTHEDRLAFVLEAQEHCDHFLSAIAEPEGKRVIVLGSGAGTEMLWCLRRGAVEVVGLDIVEQSPSALEEAVARLGLAGTGSFSMQRMAVEDAGSLGQRFDLVLSNNVFEHVADLTLVFRSCAELVEPGSGRVAVFTDPLYYSSAGSHLPLQPWEHLWGEPEEARRRLLPTLSGGHPLQERSLPDYLEWEISLNRRRLGDFVTAIEASGLVLLNLRLIPDRSLAGLGRYLERLAPELGAGGVSRADLGLEGLYFELALIREDTEVTAASLTPVEELRRSRDRASLVERIQAAEASLDVARRRSHELDCSLEDERRRRGEWEAAARELRSVLDGVERSFSFRLGRALTAPLRWLRGRTGR